jgi:hypothetical protein
MKALFTFFVCLLFFSHTHYAQTGDLFLYGAGSELQYVRFPAQTVHSLDSLPATNLASIESTLYTSFAKTEGRRTVRGIASYDLITHQRTDTTTAFEVLDVDAWDNMLVITNARPPFLQVVDPANQYQSRFELLDSSFAGWATKTLVHDDRAYVLTGENIVVVDLDLEDTIAVVRTDTIPDFWAPAYNVDIEEAGGQIYVYAEYATGAIRSTVLRIDPLTLAVSQVVHIEFLGSREMTKADDKLFVYSWPAYYDLQADSMQLDPSSLQHHQYPVAYDEASQTTFLRSAPLPITQFELIPMKNGQAGQSIITKSFSHGHFMALSQINSRQEGIGVEYAIFPNPTPDLLQVDFSAPTQVSAYRMLDAHGRTLLAGTPQGNRGFQVDLRELPRGGYFLEIRSESGSILEPVVKW